MPLYEYACLDCQDTFDSLRRMDQADAAIACPDCGGEHTSRSLSLIASPQIGKDSPDLKAGPSATAGACACGGMCSCGGH